MVAVSGDAPADRDALVKRLGLTYPVISDPDLAIVAAFGVRQEGADAPVPATYLLDADRKVLWRAVGTSISGRPSVEQALSPITLR